MKRLGLSLAVVMLLGPALAAQEQMPKPGPEHEFLKKFVGDWDVNVKSSFAPESKGSNTCKAGLGGFFVLSNFKGDFGGMPFEGHSIRGYDTFKKKYTNVWADSMGSWMMISENGTLDKSGKVLTEVAEGPDQTGKNTKYTMVTEFKDNDTIVFTMNTPENKGKDPMMTITYKRKK